MTDAPGKRASAYARSAMAAGGPHGIRTTTSVVSRGRCARDGVRPRQRVVDRLGHGAIAAGRVSAAVEDDIAVTGHGAERKQRSAIGGNETAAEVAVARELGEDHGVRRDVGTARDRARALAGAHGVMRLRERGDRARAAREHRAVGPARSPRGSRRGTS